MEPRGRRDSRLVVPAAPQRHTIPPHPRLVFGGVGLVPYRAWSAGTAARAILPTHTPKARITVEIRISTDTLLFCPSSPDYLTKQFKLRVSGVGHPRGRVVRRTARTDRGPP